MTPGRIAVIGTGAMGQAHVRALAGLGAADRIAYLCSARSPRPMREAPRAQLTTSVDEVLHDASVGIVVICTPTDTHRDLAVRALRAGKHVLLEKPIALELADAHAILRAAEEAERILMVAHVVRFFGGYEAIDDAVRAGAVGTPLAVTAERLSAPAPPSPWWQDERRSGGPLVDFAIHDFDQLNRLLGMPRAVSSRRTGSGRPIETTVDYADGGIGRVLTSMDLPPAFGFSSAIEVLGSTGLLAHRFVGASPTHRAPLSIEALGSAAPSRPYELDETDPYQRQMASFLECVERDVEPVRVTGPSAIAALMVALAAKTSLDTGKPLQLAEPTDG